MTSGVSCLRYIGHATVLAELGSVRILTDPLLRNGLFHVRRRVPLPSPQELEPLDAIVISHPHHDHFDLHSLRLVAPRCPVIVPNGCAALARRGGAKEIVQLAPGETWTVGNVVIEALNAAHDGRRFPFGDQVLALGYLFNGPHTVYFAGDTDLFPAMSSLAGRVDLALLPIWGWGPSLPAGHLDPRRAAEAVVRIRPKVAVPIHWGTYRAWGAQRGLDPLAPAHAFADGVARAAPATKVQILRPGERLTLTAKAA